MKHIDKTERNWNIAVALYGIMTIAFTASAVFWLLMIIGVI